MRLHAFVTIFALPTTALAPACMTSSSAPASDSTAEPANVSVSEAVESLANAPHTSTGVRCSDEDWQIVFWAEAEMIHPVGYMTCACFQLEDLTGVTSQWNSLVYEDVCDDGGCSTGVCQ